MRMNNITGGMQHMILDDFKDDHEDMYAEMEDLGIIITEMEVDTEAAHGY